MIRTIFAVTVAALVFGAAPPSQAMRSTQGTGADTDKVTKVFSQQRPAGFYGRRCWWRGGVRVCN